jgi:nucleoid DNA-binding protein
VRADALEVIERNIALHGHHVYLVTGEASPRYAYSIGLTGTLGAELLLAGAIQFSADEVRRIVNGVAEQLRHAAGTESVIRLAMLGSFTLRSVKPDWVKLLMLGAIDYYKDREVVAYQILPDEAHWTIDIPALDDGWSASANQPWKWLIEEWPYEVPRSSVATTNISALRGARITEAARWEEDEWELFAGSGPDVKPQDVRVVPLGVLLGVDEMLGAVVNLGVGQALWRDGSAGTWKRWGDEEPEGGVLA